MLSEEQSGTYRNTPWIYYHPYALFMHTKGTKIIIYLHIVNRRRFNANYADQML